MFKVATDRTTNQSRNGVVVYGNSHSVRCDVFCEIAKTFAGRDADPSLPSSVDVKNRVELYIYSP